MTQPSKIYSLDELEKILEGKRKLTIGHCHGVFDLLHVGHLRHFKEAKHQSDILVVTLTADEFVNKGPHRPAFNQDLRAESIAALECVDFVAVNPSPSAETAIQKIRPSLFFKGSDYKTRETPPDSKLSTELALVEKLGGKVVFTDDIQFSSSSLINSFLSPFTEEVSRYLADFRTRHTAKSINQLLTKVHDLKVLVLGETVIDEYHYCDAIGKAGKEPVLVTRFISGEQFIGGVLAIANHVAGICAKVDVLSCLGTKNSFESFIRERLRPNVTPHFVFNEGRPTIVKLRYVENYLLQKLFEVYTMDDTPVPSSEEEALCEKLRAILPNYDVVIVADYGHGMISERARALICKHSKFLAVNTQANAGNRGFHTISAYPRADYISLSSMELGLDRRTREGDVRKMILGLLETTHCKTITVTRGKHGILTYSPEHGFAEGPGLATKVVDRIGSGDAVLAITSPFASLNCPPELIAFLGNIAGSEAVRILGHSSFIDRSVIRKGVESLLK
jgi:cytidyltransferase-like protein